MCQYIAGLPLLENAEGPGDIHQSKIGTRKIIGIGRADVAKLHCDLGDKPYQANRTLGVLSKLFNLCGI